MLNLETIRQQLAGRQFKITRQRRAVLNALAASQARLSPADVYRRARRECRNLGLATVYRTLDILVELGAIRRVHLDDGCEGFAPASRAHGHHLVCTICSAAIEFEDCDLSALLKRIEGRTGFKVEQHWLELVGRCPACRNQ
jgi:Fur family ferric uptake transcriptional regulator